jgi:hypothetical protein
VHKRDQHETEQARDQKANAKEHDRFDHGRASDRKMLPDATMPRSARRFQNYPQIA